MIKSLFNFNDNQKTQCTILDMFFYCSNHTQIVIIPNEKKALFFIHYPCKLMSWIACLTKISLFHASIRLICKCFYKARRSCFIQTFIRTANV